VKPQNNLIPCAGQAPLLLKRGRDGEGEGEGIMNDEQGTRNNE